MVATTVSGSTRMNLPGLPGSAMSGRKAKISVAVHPRIATKICRVPASAACVRSAPSRRWRAMFSVTTIESSTRSPSATTKPAMEI